MFAFGGKADIPNARSNVCFYLKARVMFNRPVMLK
jgi:hypothetical protein